MSKFHRKLFVYIFLSENCFRGGRGVIRKLPLSFRENKKHQPEPTLEKKKVSTLFCCTAGAASQLGKKTLQNSTAALIVYKQINEIKYFCVFLLTVSSLFLFFCFTMSHRRGEEEVPGMDKTRLFSARVAKIGYQIE